MIQLFRPKFSSFMLEDYYERRKFRYDILFLVLLLLLWRYNFNARDRSITHSSQR